MAEQDDIDLVLESDDGRLIVSHEFRRIMRHVYSTGVVTSFRAPPDWTLDEAAASIAGMVQQNVEDEDPRLIAKALAWIEERRKLHASKAAAVRPS